MGEGSTLIDPQGPRSPDDNCWGGSPDLPQANKEKILRHRLGKIDLLDQAENVTFVVPPRRHLECTIQMYSLKHYTSDIRQLFLVLFHNSASANRLLMRFTTSMLYFLTFPSSMNVLLNTLGQIQVYCITFTQFMLRYIVVLAQDLFQVRLPSKTGLNY